MFGRLTLKSYRVGEARRDAKRQRRLKARVYLGKGSNVTANMFMVVESLAYALDVRKFQNVRSKR